MPTLKTKSNLKINHINKLIYITEIDSQREKNLMVTKWNSGSIEVKLGDWN